MWAMSVTATSFAALAHIRGDFDETRQRYLEATDAMTRHGSLHGDIFREFALATVGFSERDFTGLEPTLRDLYKQAGPVAAASAKQLVARVAHEGDGSRLDADNAALIARLRVSPEGQEGLTAFRDKRKPAWIQS